MTDTLEFHPKDKVLDAARRLRDALRDANVRPNARESTIGYLVDIGSILRDIADAVDELDKAAIANGDEAYGLVPWTAAAYPVNGWTAHRQEVVVEYQDVINQTNFHQTFCICRNEAAARWLAALLNSVCHAPPTPPVVIVPRALASRAAKALRQQGEHQIAQQLERAL